MSLESPILIVVKLLFVPILIVFVFVDVPILIVFALFLPIFNISFNVVSIPKLFPNNIS